MIDFKKNLRVSAFSKLPHERLISFMEALLNFILGVDSFFFENPVLTNTFSAVLYFSV